MHGSCIDLMGQAGDGRGVGCGLQEWSEAVCCSLVCKADKHAWKASHCRGLLCMRGDKTMHSLLRERGQLRLGRLETGLYVGAKRKAVGPQLGLA